MNTKEPKSSAVYTPAVLRWYDAWVLGFSNRWVWRCPTRRLLAWYDRHVTGNHLEVGPGTGWFLDRCRWPTARPRLVLLDANAYCLATAARRVARHQPETVQADVIQPLPAFDRPFDSIGLNYVLHCLPGDLRSKAVVFDHLGAVLAPGGVLFGSTILGEGVRHTWLGRWHQMVYNRSGIVDNRHDRVEDLHEALVQRFDDVAIEVVGCVALFRGRRTTTPSSGV